MTQVETNFSKEFNENGVKGIVRYTYHSYVMSRWGRRVMWAWFIFTVLNYLYLTYSTGVGAYHRWHSDNLTADIMYERIRDACNSNKFDRFMESLILPLTFLNSVIPYLVMQLYF